MENIYIRSFDILVSFAALMLFLPIFCFIALILKFSDDGEIFYQQARIGKDGKKFNVIKFATMKKNSPMIGSGLITAKNDPRIFRFGRILRKTKLNELPQLYNVLVGEMSLIGPRPLSQIGYDIYDTKTREKIVTVTPGLSGVGSIVLRDEEEILQRVDIDPVQFYTHEVSRVKGDLECWYIENRSMKINLILILCTIDKVLRPKSRLIYVVCPNMPRIPMSLQKFMNI